MKELMEAGMNVARLNMSHGDYEEHQRRLDLVRSVSAELGLNVAALGDLQGPKIRTGVFEKAEGQSNGKIILKRGDKFTITIDDIIGNQERVSTTFKGLPGDCNPGDVILIDDGNVSLKVLSVTDTDVNCECIVPGAVSDHKGINLPGVPVSLPAMTEKDEENLRWCLGVGIDLIALSFVRHGSDVDRVHQIMDEEGRRVPVIAKLEKPQAIENLDSIIDSFDAVMVARGDMAVECPLERAVSMMIGTPETLRTSRQTSTPLRPGSIRSSRMRSGLNLSKTSRALDPLEHQSVTNLSLCRTSWSISARAGSSSTTRIRWPDDSALAWVTLRPPPLSPTLDAPSRDLRTC